MNERPIEPQDDEPLRRMVAEEIAATDPREIRFRTRRTRRRALAGIGLTMVAVAALVAALVWRTQSASPIAGPSGIPGETPTAVVSATATPTPGPTAFTAPAVTLMPGLTPGPTADPASKPGKGLACTWSWGTAVALADGRVLAAQGCGDLSTAVFDAVTRTFSESGKVTASRGSGTATLLEDGRVLFAGGYGDVGQTARALTTDEIYDPTTGRFTPIAPVTPHGYADSVLLSDGRVLIVGGSLEDPTAPYTAEIFDPVSSTFVAAGALPGAPNAYGIFGTRLVLLNDARVLIVDLDSDERWRIQIYDPATNTFKAGAQAGTEPQAMPCAGRLPDGRVMLFGEGMVEVYDPSTDTFSRLAGMPAMTCTASVSLTDGRILAIGEVAMGSALELRQVPLLSRWADRALFGPRPAATPGRTPARSTIPWIWGAAVYDPATGRWTDLGNLNAEHFSIAVAPLPDGGAIVIGDPGHGDRADQVELFDSRTGKFTLSR